MAEDGGGPDGGQQTELGAVAGDGRRPPVAREHNLFSKHTGSTGCSLNNVFF